MCQTVYDVLKSVSERWSRSVYAVWGQISDFEDQIDRCAIFPHNDPGLGKNTPK
ncbi:MAG: hypothetical protein ACJAR9_000480 [Celeribacter sp.]|jgi:hypothetical protein